MNKNESLYKFEVLAAAEYLGVKVENLKVKQYSPSNISGTFSANGQERYLPKVSATDTTNYRYWAVQVMLNCLK